MKSRVYTTCVGLIGLTLGGYGMYCASHMVKYIGTGHYWSNTWFIQAHVVLIGMFAVSALLAQTKK